MSGFEWVTYDEDAAPAPVYGPEPPDESFDDTEFEVALGGYSDGRKEEAERRRVDAVMAEAKREGAKLQEFLKNPQAMRDHDARLAADAAEAAAVAHGTASDGDSSCLLSAAARLSSVASVSSRSAPAWSGVAGTCSAVWSLSLIHI